MRDQTNLLRSVSRSFYLSMRFLPPEMREPVSLGYLLARYTDTIADAPGMERDERLAHLDGVRLAIQGERESFPGIGKSAGEAIEHPGERELLVRSSELLAAYRAVDAANRDHLHEVILTIVHGQSWDVSFFGEGGLTACGTADDLLRYTYQVAGCVGDFWTKVGYTNLGGRFADPDKTHEMLRRGRKLGQALQLVNILRDLHEDLPGGRCYLPAEELRAAGWNGEGMPSTGEVGPVFERWLSLCEDFLGEADGYARSLRGARVAFCTRLPQLLAKETARRLREAGAGRAMRERIKVSRREVWAAAAVAAFF